MLSAALSWWTKENPLPQDDVRRALEEAGAEDIRRRDEDSLGSALRERLRLDDRASAFWAAASVNPALRHMLEEAVRAWRVDNGLSRVQAARRFVEVQILREAGRAARESGVLEEREPEIRHARRKRR